MDKSLLTRLNWSAPPAPPSHPTLQQLLDAERVQQAQAAPAVPTPPLPQPAAPKRKFGIPGWIKRKVVQTDIDTALGSHTRVGKAFGVIDFKPPAAPGGNPERPASLGLREKLIQAHRSATQKASLEHAAAARAALFETGGASAIAPGMAEALDDPLAFGQMVARRFGASAATARLIACLQECAAAPYPGDAGDVDLLRPVLLAHALGMQPVRLPGGDNLVDAGVEDVQAAFDYMTGSMDWDELTSTPPTGRAAVLAWKCAEVLARTDAGFALLTDLMHVKPPPAEREAMRTLLQAVDHLRDDLAMQQFKDAPPQALRRQGPSLDDSLAKRVLLASAARLNGVELPPDPNATGDLFAWRQGFRDDGPGSALSALRGRMHKFVRKAVPRAENKGAGKLLNNMLGRKKAALDGLRHGAQSTHLSSVPKEMKKYCLAFQAACTRLADAIELMAATGRGAGRLAPAQHRAVAAQLRAWAAIPNPARPEQFSMTPEAMQEIGVPAGTPVTVDLLARMALAGGIPVSRVEQDLKVVGAIEQAADLKPRAMERAEIADTINRLVAGMQSNARLKLNSAGVHGLSTVGASAMLAKLTQFLPLSLRLNLRGERSRHATFELARTAHGFEVFIGTTRGLRKQAGGGVRFGWDIDLGVLEGKAGPGLAVTPYDHEDSDPRGVIFRIAPPTNDSSDEAWSSVKYDEQAMIATTQKLMAFLLDAENVAMPANALWNAVAEQFGEGVSVGWQSGSVDTDRQKVSTDVGVWGSVGIGKYKLHGAIRAAASNENTSKQATSVDETGGTQPVHQRKIGSGMVTSAGAGITLNVGKELSSGQPGNAVSSGSLDLLSVNVAATDQAESVKLNLPSLDGRLFDRACFMDTELSDVEAFAQKIGQERDAWERMFASVHARDRTQGPITPAMLASPDEVDREAGAARLDAFVASARANALPNTKLLVRERLAPSAARAYDRYNTILAQTRGRSGGGDCEGKQRQLLASPASWLPHKLALGEKIARKDAAGLRAGVRVFKQVSAEGARELLGEQFS